MIPVRHCTLLFKACMVRLTPEVTPTMSSDVGIASTGSRPVM